jgi:hypothetical protein
MSNDDMEITQEVLSQLSTTIDDSNSTQTASEKRRHDVFEDDDGVTSIQVGLLIYSLEYIYNS